MVRHTLGFYGHEVISESHGVTEDGMRYFGVMMLKSAYGGYEDAVALRNSHDKKFPIGIGFGGHVFCCDNMSLMADHVIRRKHTANAKRDLPGLVAEVVEPLADARDRQQRAFNRYRATAALAGTRRPRHPGAVSYRRDQPESHTRGRCTSGSTPSFEELEDTGFYAWRLFNAVTFVLNGRILGEPQSTQGLASHHRRRLHVGLIFGMKREVSLCPPTS